MAYVLGNSMVKCHFSLGAADSEHRGQGQKTEEMYTTHLGWSDVTEQVGVPMGVHRLSPDRLPAISNEHVRDSSSRWSRRFC